MKDEKEAAPLGLVFFILHPSDFILPLIRAYHRTPNKEPILPTQLNHYRLLGHSGLRVSPLCLGTMTFGEEWGWGGSKEDSRAVFDAYAAAGGNFIDTANLYTNGTSEVFVGEFLQGRRDQFVVATKFAFSMRPNDPNCAGNGRKNMVQACEASLRRLRTDHIDLYWVHAWDGITPIDETMRAFDDLVRAGKVLYLGVSDYPAWKASQANAMAELRGWSKFVGLQVEYSLVERTPERDLIPMAKDLGLGVTPWSPLGQGVLTGKFSRGSREAGARLSQREAASHEMSGKYLTDRAVGIGDVVVAIAKEVGRSPAQVALAWLLAQRGVTSPIIGARRLSQLQDNLASVEVDLSPDHMARLNDASQIEMGFPHAFLGTSMIQSMLRSGTVVNR
jgi:aryl-alcohol dehydrogenase-like predicted oxidoreductase